MILLDSVTKQYAGDPEPALDNVSLHIEPNEFVFLVGKSGAGKSTLMKMITKEESPDSGKIIIGGIDLDYVKKRHIPGYRRRLGVVFQDFKLLPKRTVYENVAFALEIAGMSGREIRKTVPKVLELVDLLDQAKKFPRQLSGGQQQRVSIARSVARQPKILIADEPTANLDKLTTKEIIDLLKKINDFGTTILVTTHNENVVNNLQKRVITLKNGRIVNDQKNNGIYRLDETPVPPEPVRRMQVPGHAFRPRPEMINVAAPQVDRKIIQTETGSVATAPVSASRSAMSATMRTTSNALTNGTQKATGQTSSRAVRNTAKNTVKTTTRRTTTVKQAPKQTVKQTRYGMNRKVI
jgi:cell division transport system ATP-binding protein